MMPDKTQDIQEPVVVMAPTAAEMHAAWLQKMEREKYEAGLRNYQGDMRRRERERDSCRN